MRRSAEESGWLNGSQGGRTLLGPHTYLHTPTHPTQAADTEFNLSSRIFLNVRPSTRCSTSCIWQLKAQPPSHRYWEHNCRLPTLIVGFGLLMFPNYPRLSPLFWKLTVSHTRFPTLPRQHCNALQRTLSSASARPERYIELVPGSDKTHRGLFGLADRNTVDINGSSSL